MTPSLNMQWNLRPITSRWPSDYFPFPKLKEHLTGRRFSSESDVKKVADNWLNGQERDFCQAGLNKSILRSDKCLNRFGDCVEKLSTNMPLNSLLYFLANVNK
ncbi:hypothetical protein AVEN_94686-1 [Araneus ventricosus]|uniref:Uncharacterized protein n=1 Tax=Araneus ventricosus TaxID=182803 RepID=A0A4Y2I679_ARAVE|nr:hypothetical protein AVEN_94686-1 [Araneus ventricosus]